MIDLLEEHLSRLRDDIDDPGMAIMGLVPYLNDGSLTPEAEETIFALPARIPDYLRALEAVMKETLDDRARGFAGGLFAYVFNPIDIISADELGYLGYIEDAVICWKGLLMLERRFGVAPGVASPETDTQRTELVWGLLADDVKDAVESFLRQFESMLGTFEF